MLVRPHEFTDHVSRAIHVFPVRDVLQFVEQTYRRPGRRRAQPALDRRLGRAAGRVRAAGRHRNRRDGLALVLPGARARAGEGGGGTARAWSAGNARRPTAPVGGVVHESYADPGLPGGQQAAQTALFEACRFYGRAASGRTSPTTTSSPRPTSEFDFHEAISLLADHPVLLRRLGLVIDLVVQVNKPTAVLPAQGVLRAVPNGDLPEDPPRCPGTRYELDDARFGARPAPRASHAPCDWSRTSRGSSGTCSRSTSTGPRSRPSASAARTPRSSIRSCATPPRRARPAPGSPLGRARAGRWQRGETLVDDLVERRDANTAITSGGTVQFNAEDLVRGYRVDMWDEEGPNGGRRRSLHERVTHHEVTGLADGLEDVHDEGYVKATAASSEREDHRRRPTT